jgi:hypothetical protein
MSRRYGISSGGRTSMVEIWLCSELDYETMRPKNLPHSGIGSTGA